MKLLTVGNLEVSAMCLGATAFDPDHGAEATDRLYELFRASGGNFFDTAHCYGFWNSRGAGCFERSLGECIRRHGDVGKVAVATKGGHPDAGERYRRPEAYVAPALVASDIAESLERLGVDCIDLFLLHRDDRRVPVAEIIEMLNVHVTTGHIGCLGASNWTTARIAEANAYAASRGLHGFVGSQVQWSLAQPNAAPPETDLSPRFLYEADAAWHAESKLPVMAYSPTARGYFATADTAAPKAAKAFENPTTRGRLDRCRQLGSQLGVTSNRIAVAYLMHQTFPVIPILGTGSPEHLADALAADGEILLPEQVRWLREG